MLNRLTPEFAEFFGMLLGDGSLLSYEKHRFHLLKFSGNSQTDILYYRLYVAKLLEGLFKKQPVIRFRKEDNTVDCYIYSKSIVKYLITELNFPAHKNDLKIKANERELFNIEYTSHFLRGFFDTDGSIYRKYGNYAQIGFRNHNRDILTYIFTLLKKEGFNPSFERKYGNVFIHRQGEINHFFEKIGSSNPKHIVRYLHWKKTSFLPKIDEVKKMSLLKKFDKKLPFFDII